MTLHLPKKKKSFLVNINVFYTQDTLVMQTNDVEHTTIIIPVSDNTINNEVQNFPYSGGI